MTTIQPRHLLVIVAITLAAALLVIGFQVVTDSDPSHNNPSHSVAEAKARGLLVATLEARPAVLALPQGSFHIASAWVEERAHRSVRLWFFRDRRLKGYSLCLTLLEGELPGDWFFVSGDEGKSLLRNGGPPFVYQLDLGRSEEVEALRLSLLESWRAPRAKDITFVASAPRA